MMQGLKRDRQFKLDELGLVNVVRLVKCAVKEVSYKVVKNPQIHAKTGSKLKTTNQLSSSISSQQMRNKNDRRRRKTYSVFGKDWTTDKQRKDNCDINQNRYAT